MRNGFEAITLMYEGNSISYLKKTMLGSSSCEFIKRKNFKITIENKINILTTMFFLMNAM